MYRIQILTWFVKLLTWNSHNRPAHMGPKHQRTNEKRIQKNATASFTSNKKDLKDIYLTFVRSVVEQSAVVWHSSLTLKSSVDLERIQKGL